MEPVIPLKTFVPYYFIRVANWILSAIRYDAVFLLSTSFLGRLYVFTDYLNQELILKAGPLISPDHCKFLCSQFMVHVDCIVTLVLLAEVFSLAP